MKVSTRTEVIGVASGKGGVGKTTVAVNLAIALHQMGRRVMLFDADLGLANSQIALGCSCPFNLGHFMSGQKTLQEIIITSRQGIKLIPGASGVSELAALSRVQASRVVQSFSALEDDIDYLVVDMAAGIAPSVLAFMAACQRRLIVVRDDPSSIADAYGMIKVLIQEQNLNEIYIIPNAVKNQAGGQSLFRRINQVCAQFLNYTTKYLGSIENDDQILAAHRKFQPIIEFAPESASSRDFKRLAKSVEQMPRVGDFAGGMQFLWSDWFASKPEKPAVMAARMYEDVHNNSEALVLAHLGMVKRVALHLKVRIPPFMELDELIQVGMIGLLEAARAFIPAKGIDFENFALSRVRGAMLDEVRQLSYLPRSAVAFNSSENKAKIALATELGRTPTQTELAEHLGEDLDVFQKKRGNAKRFETLSMELITDEVMGIADERSRQPDAIVEHRDFMRAVGDAIAALPQSEQLLMSLYYVEELNLKEIGATLGVTESRVSQLLSAIVKKIRVVLKIEVAPKAAPGEGCADLMSEILKFSPLLSISGGYINSSGD